MRWIFNHSTCKIALEKRDENNINSNAFFILIKETIYYIAKSRIIKITITSIIISRASLNSLQ